jgi:hypothetical protein
MLDPRMSTLLDEGPGLPNPAVQDGRELHGLECVGAVPILPPSHTHVTVDADDARPAATGRRARESRRRRAHCRPALRGPFPRIVATDAAQVGEDPVDDAGVLDHGDTFHLDATARAEQRIDLEDPARLEPRGRAQLRRRDRAVGESSRCSASVRTSERGAPVPV